MPSTTNRDIKELLFALEITLVGGLLTTWGILSFAPLAFLGVLITLFGVWVSFDTYANGARPNPHGESEHTE